MQSEVPLSQPSQASQDSGSLYEPPLSPGCSSSRSSDTLGSIANLVEGGPGDQPEDDDVEGAPPEAM